MRHAIAPRRVSVTLLLALVLVALGSFPAAADLPDSSIYGPDIEDYAEFEAQTRCLPQDDRLGVTALRDQVLDTYDVGTDGGIVRACHLGGASLHKEGRAWDWMLNASDSEHAAAADEFLTWLFETDVYGNEHAMARRLGVTHVIWDRRVWSAEAPDAGWRPYKGVSPHTDHIHIDFTTEGANGTTSFFNPPAAGELRDALEGVEPAGPLRTIDLVDWVDEVLVERLGFESEL